MSKLSTWLLGAGLGAGLMYFLDPDMGNRRKALVRDQFNRMVNKSDEALEKSFRDLRNRTRGLMAETTARLSDQETPDWILAERVRAKAGPLMRTPGSINVEVREGVAYLSGPVLREDVDRLMQGLTTTRGINKIENNLQAYETVEDIPTLQGAMQQESTPMRNQAANWTPSARLLAGIGAGTLFLAGRRRRGLIGTAFSLAGLGLAFRAVTNMELTRALGFAEDKEVIHVNKGINIYAPVEEVYEYWSNYENFPRFMEHISEIRKLGENRSHWVVQGPANIPVEFETITTRDEPGNIIAWETVPESEVKHRGRVRFREAADGSTQVNVNMWYTPPAGVVGHAIAKVFGTDPKQAMDEDLVRLKSLLEEGKTTAKGREVEI